MDTGCLEFNKIILKHIFYSLIIHQCKQFKTTVKDNNNIKSRHSKYNIFCTKD